jgi:hypothetical protein
MTAETLLSHLEKSRRTGHGTWIACCPAHDDKSPSMTIRELEDGRVLLHCFAGCEVQAVLGAVGLDFDALFPPKPIDYAKPMRRPFPAADVVEAIMRDALTLQQIAISLEAVADPCHRPALQGIVARVAAARDLVNG